MLLKPLKATDILLLQLEKGDVDFQDIFNLWRIRNDTQKTKKQMLISDYFITLKTSNHGRYNSEIFFLFLIL